MSGLAIVLIVLLAVIVLLVLGGVVASARRAQAREAGLRRQIAQANEALAVAHAEDRGWDRDVLDAAARAAFMETHPDAQIEELLLVRIEDHPGTEDDVAVFRVVAGGHESTLALRRSEGAWVARR